MPNLQLLEVVIVCCYDQFCCCDELFHVNFPMIQLLNDEIAVLMKMMLIKMTSAQLLNEVRNNSVRLKSVSAKSYKEVMYRMECDCLIRLGKFKEAKEIQRLSKPTFQTSAKEKCRWNAKQSYLLFV